MGPLMSPSQRLLLVIFYMQGTCILYTHGLRLHYISMARFVFVPNNQRRVLYPKLGNYVMFLYNEVFSVEIRFIKFIMHTIKE